MSLSTPKTIVVPVDSSDECFLAIDTALQLAESPADVRLVHVIPELNSADPGIVWQEIDNENRRQHASDAIREKLSAAKYQGVEVDIEIGDPGHRTVEFAKRVGAELIVMPSHGRTGVAHMLIGSVTERVLRISDCPVLVLKS